MTDMTEAPLPHDQSEPDSFSSGEIDNAGNIPPKADNISNIVGHRIVRKEHTEAKPLGLGPADRSAVEGLTSALTDLSEGTEENTSAASLAPDKPSFTPREHPITHTHNPPTTSRWVKWGGAAAAFLGLVGIGGWAAKNQMDSGDTEGRGAVVSIATPQEKKETPTPSPTSTPEATPTPKPTLEQELPYEVGFKKEYQGADKKIILQIASDEMEAQKSPVKTINLTSTEVSKFGLQYTEDDLIQRLNDAVLEGDLLNLRLKKEYQNLTLDELKKMIHDGNAPKYTIPDAFKGKSDRKEDIEVDTAAPVYITLVEKPGQVKYSDKASFNYRQVQGNSLVVEIAVNGQDFGVGTFRNTLVIPGTLQIAYGIMPYRELHGGNYLPISQDIMNHIQQGKAIISDLVPINNTSGTAGILEIN